MMMMMRGDHHMHGTHKFKVRNHNNKTMTARSAARNGKLIAEKGEVFMRIWLRGELGSLALGRL